MRTMRAQVRADRLGAAMAGGRRVHLSVGKGAVIHREMAHVGLEREPVICGAVRLLPYAQRAHHACVLRADRRHLHDITSAGYAIMHAHVYTWMDAAPPAQHKPRSPMRRSAHRCGTVEHQSHIGWFHTRPRTTQC